MGIQVGIDYVLRAIGFGAIGSDITPVSAANPLPTTNSAADVAAIGGLTETAPTTDTASSGLNGRLQRIAQRLTSLLSFFAPATAARSAVASGVASVTILASNAARKGATIANDDANALYLDLSGGTASATGYSVQVPGNNGYYEVPFGYTGLITGIWAADGSGSARVTEFS